MEGNSAIASNTMQYEKLTFHHGMNSGGKITWLSQSKQQSVLGFQLRVVVGLNVRVFVFLFRDFEARYCWLVPIRDLYVQTKILAGLYLQFTV